MSVTIDQALFSLKESIINMMQLVNNQITDSQKCIINLDTDLADEIRSVEKVVNRYDTAIDKKCESIIALYNPVATDLRFVLASIRIGSDLERIGDLVYGISKYVRKDIITDPFNQVLLENVKFHELYDLVNLQVNNSIEGFINEDVEIARKILKNDLISSEINKGTLQHIESYLKKAKSSEFKNGMYLFSIMNKLERISALCSNVAEETIYYLEAVSLRHKKIKIKKKELRNMVSDALEDGKDK